MGKNKGRGGDRVYEVQRYRGRWGFLVSGEWVSGERSWIAVIDLFQSAVRNINNWISSFHLPNWWGNFPLLVHFRNVAQRGDYSCSFLRLKCKYNSLWCLSVCLRGCLGGCTSELEWNYKHWTESWREKVLRESIPKISTRAFHLTAESPGETTHPVPPVPPPPSPPPPDRWTIDSSAVLAYEDHSSPIIASINSGCILSTCSGRLFGSLTHIYHPLASSGPPPCVCHLRAESSSPCG